MIQVVAGHATDTGQARAINQDAYLVEPPIYAVADGMGGHSAGEVASSMAVNEFVRSVDALTPAGLHAAVLAANQAVFDRSIADISLRGMGTTLVGVGVSGDDPDRLVLVNVGDSRAYLSDGRRLMQLSEDHSLVATLVRAGQLTEAEAEHHPQRNVVTRALGIEPDIAVDVFEFEPAHGDRVVLCSDGLFNEVPSDLIVAILAQRPEPFAAAEALVAAANEHGGNDNITCIVLDIYRDEQPARDVQEDRGLRRIDIDGGGDLELPVTQDEITAVMAAINPDALGDASGSQVERGPLDDGFAAELRAAEAAIGPDSAERGTVDPPAAAPDDPVVRTAEHPALVAEPPDGFSDAGAAERVVDPDAQSGAFRGSWPRRIAFVAAVLAVLGVGWVAVEWYASNSYFVGVDDGRIVVYRGQPGGLLWTEPAVSYRTKGFEANVSLENDQRKLSSEVTFSDRAEAITLAESLADRATTTTSSTTSTTTTSTTTTTTTTTTVAPGGPATAPTPPAATPGG